MRLGDLINFEGGSFAVHPAVLREFGTKAGLFLCRIIWWQRDAEEWIEKSIDKIQHETGLTVKEQRTIREYLCECGVLDEEYHRLDHKLRFRIKASALQRTIGESGKTFSEDEGKTEGGGMCPKGLSGNAERADGQSPKGQMAKRPKGLSLKEELKDQLKDKVITAAKPAANSSLRQFSDQWCECFEAHFGKKYLHKGAADMNATKALLAHETVDAVIGVATMAWSKPALFNCKQAVTIAGLKSRWNEILAELDPHKKGAKAPTQEELMPAGSYSWEEAINWKPKDKAGAS